MAYLRVEPTALWFLSHRSDQVSREAIHRMQRSGLGYPRVDPRYP